MKAFILGTVLFPILANAHMASLFQKEENSLCFSHQYSSEQLSSNSKQELKALKIQISRDPMYPGEYTMKVNAKLRTQVLIRGNKTDIYPTYKNTLFCREDGSCSVECDGGQVQLAYKKKQDLLVFINKGFVIHGGCGIFNSTRWFHPQTQADAEITLNRCPVK